MKANRLSSSSESKSKQVLAFFVREWAWDWSSSQSDISLINLLFRFQAPVEHTAIGRDCLVGARSCAAKDHRDGPSSPLHIDVYFRFTTKYKHASEKKEPSQARLTVFASIVALVSALIGSYIGPYLQNSIAGRDHLSSALASYYAAAASEFYAQQALSRADKAKTDKSSLYYLELMKENDLHYQEFLAAGTRLSAEVPESLQKRVLEIEGEWDEINDNLDDEAERRWFAIIDDIRQKVIESRPPKRFLEPIR